MSNNITFDEIIKITGDVIAEKSKMKFQKSFGSKLSKGSKLYCFNISTGYESKIKFELERKKIPYVDICIKNGLYFLILSEHSEKAKKIIDKIHENISKNRIDCKADDFLIELSQGEVTEKTTLAGVYVSFWEMELLRKKCKDIALNFNFAVTQDENDLDTFLINYDAKYTLSKSPSKNDFCKALLYTVIALEGYNSDYIICQIENDAIFEEKLEKIFDENKNTTSYIVSNMDYDRKEYVKLTEDEFVHGFATNNLIESRVSAYDEKFYYLLFALIDQMPEKRILNSKEFKKWANDFGDNISDEDKKDILEENALQIKYKMAVQDLVDMVDYAIKDRIKKGNISFSQPAYAFSFYMKEAGKIIDACINKDEAQLSELKNIYSSALIDKIINIETSRKIDFEDFGDIKDNLDSKTIDFVNLKNLINYMETENSKVRPDFSNEYEDKE